MEKTAVFKYYRLKMSDELRLLITGIPVKNIKEIHKGDHVYLGHGNILIGSKEHVVTIKVVKNDNGFMCKIYSPSSNMRIKSKFDSVEDVSTTLDLIKKEIQKKLN